MMKCSQGPMALVLLLLAVCSLSTEAVAVTPVEKVVQLLAKLQAQVEEEGKEEAAAYDKFACFCKEEVDDKLYAVEKSTAKIEKFDAQIEKLGAEITALDGEISDLGKEIDRLTGEMKIAKETRGQEHDSFKVDLADVDGAISACERALDALKESKGNLGGKSELEAAALAQVQVLARTVLGAGSHMALSASEMSRLSTVLAAGQPGKANEYKYHANDIIATIESLRNKFKDKKLALEQEEFDTNSGFEKRQLSMANEQKFAEKDKMEKDELAEQKREEKGLAEADRTQETTEKNADHSFMDVLTEECETKARLWDQRSQTRAGEVKALSEAMTALKEGVAPNYQANKKLVGLQRRSIIKAHWVYIEDSTVAQKVGSAALVPAFLQTRSAGLRGSFRGSLSQKVSELLLKSADQLKSPFLSAAALKVIASEDHFVKVRQIIKDLVARLQSDAASEKTQKSFCDDEIKKAVEQRDAEQSKVEDFKAKITGKEADKAQLKEEIAQLSQQIAENKRALMEATELRENESKENLHTIEESDAGKEAVTQAVEVLKTFYGGAAFLQKAAYVPPNSDREGKTVADRAPEVFDEDYKGSQEASKGILGILEVILSDFERTIATVTEQEGEAAEAFATFKSESEADTKIKEELVATKEGEIADIEAELTALADETKEATESHRQALDELEKLHTMCVAGEETYEERVAKRQKEIEALKEAHDMLEHWQS
mmetsp:Transcript_22332/g.72283  ORF Transcript_22332/g.72283 Transcript_22332/m.72283 type:complete len:721 (-) Transcript_22332:46-2208(-)